MPSLRVPHPHEDAVRELLALSDTDADSIVARIDGAEPVQSVLRDATALHEPPEKLLQALIALAAVRLDIQETPEELISMLQDAVPNSPSTNGAGLLKLLSAKPVVRAAKTVDLANSTPARCTGFRIVTDIRPVFDEEISEAIPAAFITQTLKISFISDGREQDLYIVVDEDDLDRIESQVHRAKNKQNAARKMIESSGASTISELELK